MKKEMMVTMCLVLLLASCAPEGKKAIDPADGTIGYIGCSNTRETVEGYHYIGGEKMWPYERRYGSGSVRDWARDAETVYWKVFDELLEEYPQTKVIWWQLCIPDNERDTDGEYMEMILQQIRKRIPGVMIYVSPLADYTDGFCEITGTAGIERAKALAEELDLRNEDVIPGPVLGPMTPTDTAEDGCHLSEEGLKTLGQQMREFFETDSRQNIAEDSGSDNVEDSAATNDLQASPEVLPSLKEESPEEKVWKQRVDMALAPTTCPDTPQPEYPSDYYQGPLTDTHLHIPAIPDWPPEEDDSFQDQAPEGRFGGPQALLGSNIKMSEIACTLKQEGTHKNFAFFPVYEGEISLHLLEIWNKTMAIYPGLFTPFIMSSGNDDQPDGFPTVDAETLQEMLAAYPQLFQGYGEIGLYARENGGSPELPPDSKRLLDIYPLIKKHNLIVYFHLGEGHKDNFEKVLAQYPEINFIWHGDQLSPDDVENILNKYPNAFYGIDAFWGHEQDLFHMFVGKSKKEYLDTLNKRWDIVLNYAISDWKEVIERHPDQVLWGIDRGDAVWNYDLDVGRAQVKLARVFIGRLNPTVQEKFAYKNAERLLREQ